MISQLKGLSEKKKSLLIIFCILSIAIIFEALQQLYYINRYNLSNEATFLGILQTQIKSWLIWFMFTIPLVLYIKSVAQKASSSVISFVKITLMLLSLVLLCIGVIAFIQLTTSEPQFTLSLFLTEYLPFFFYQKMPIFTLGFIAIAIMSYLYFTNIQLLIKVEELGELKKTHAKLYQQLATEIDDKSTILNIKVGNKRKIIPVTKISWIAADDYCVKVYTTDNECHTMRSSLKSLENKLDSNFLRVHRKAIVNMTMAKELNLNNNPKLIITDNTEIPVSKSNLKLVRNFLL